MFRSLPQLRLLAVALLSIVSWPVPARTEPPASVYGRGATRSGAASGVRLAAHEQAVTSADPVEAAAQAERIVASSLSALERCDTLSVRVRQKVRVGDRVLVGGGRYVQSGHGEDQRFRYESTLQCDTETFEVVEVCDGLFCWAHRRLGGAAPQLERLDVRRVRERLVALNASASAPSAAYLGGLQRSLWLTRQWFKFVAASPVEVDGTPTWRVEGRWNPDYLAGILPQFAEAGRRPGGITPTELPDGVPWGVRVSVARGDLMLRQVEWLGVPGTRPVTDAAPEPIAVLDLVDASIGGPVDASMFVYRPATEGLIDVSEAFAAGLWVMRP